MRVPRPRKVYFTITAKIRTSQISEEEVRKVLTTYDLENELEDYSPPPTSPGRCQNLILKMRNGKKVLKRYKSDFGLDEIKFEHSVLRYLSTTDFPVPRLVLNRDGVICTELEGRYYAISDFISGFKYTDFYVSSQRKGRFIGEAAQTLAHYHQLMEGFVPEGRKVDGFMLDGKRRWREHPWYLRGYDKFESLLKDREPNETELKRFFLQNMERFRQDFVDLSRKLEEKNHLLPKLAIHGDYRFGNILFDKDRLVAVLDFECTHLDWRAREVIVVVHRFACTGDGIDYDKARLFFDAYQSYCTLTDDEIALMPDIFRLSRQQRLVSPYSEDRFGAVDSQSLRHARDLVWWLDWMEKNGHQLIEEMIASGRTRNGAK
jgi:Ser/Thr protein kinase RdoA (MazF antagonist)